MLAQQVRQIVIWMLTLRETPANLQSKIIQCFSNQVVMVFTKFLSCAAIVFSMLITPIALAKTKQTKSSKIIGVKCTQGPESVTIGISEFKPNQRKNFRKGMRIRVNVAGIGPLDCRVI
jgi:hypothetical protein